MTSWTLQVRWFTNVVAMLSLRVQDFNLQSSPCWWILVVPVCSCCWLKTPSLEHDPQGFLLVAEPQDCSRNYVYCLNQAFLVRTHSRLPKLYMRTAGWLFDLTLSLRRTDVVVRCAAHWDLPAAALQLCGCDCDDKEEKNDQKNMDPTTGALPLLQRGWDWWRLSFEIPEMLLYMYLLNSF